MKARRLANLPPPQRTIHEAEQARKKWEHEARMQQFTQVQEGDAFISAAQAECRAEIPREMFDRSSREEARDILQSRGINLASKEALAQAVSPFSPKFQPIKRSSPLLDSTMEFPLILLTLRATHVSRQSLRPVQIFRQPLPEPASIAFDQAAWTQRTVMLLPSCATTKSSHS